MIQRLILSLAIALCILTSASVVAIETLFEADFAAAQAYETASKP